MSDSYDQIDFGGESDQNFNFDQFEYDNESYENYLKNSWINKCNSNFYKGIESDKFFMDLLEISDYSCYYCCYIYDVLFRFNK